MIATHFSDWSNLIEKKVSNTRKRRTVTIAQATTSAKQLHQTGARLKASRATPEQSVEIYLPTDTIPSSTTFSSTLTLKASYNESYCWLDISLVLSMVRHIPKVRIVTLNSRIPLLLQSSNLVPDSLNLFGMLENT